MNTTVVLLLGITLVALLHSTLASYDEGFNQTVLPRMWAIRLSDFDYQMEPGLTHQQKMERISQKYGLKNLGQIGILEGYYLVMHDESNQGNRKRSVADMHEALAEEPHIDWYEFQHPRRHNKRLGPINDPLYPQQWHLHNREAGGLDMNVGSAWDTGVSGRGVTVCVVDDGLEWRHNDFGSSRFRASASYDWNSRDSDPSPALYDDTHGTSCGGLAFAGMNNGVCGVGVAYNAGISAQRLISGPTTDAMEANALGFQLSENDIFTSSWGPTDDGARLEGPGRLLALTLERGVKTGRNGKGAIYVWAGGNGGTKDNVNYDGYANSRYTIAIGSVSSNGQRAYYSEHGASLVVSATSSPPGIVSTAVNGRCTEHFGGTSAASPMVAGVIALMLEANPNLGWRDVQDILIRTASKNDPTDSDWMNNGGGLHVNHKYGFGLTNAGAAVAMAKNHSRPLLLPQQDYSYTYIASPSQDIPDGIGELTTYLDVADNFIVEHVEVTLRVVHNRRGDLRVTLKAPSGLSSVLMVPHSDKGANIPEWTFTSMRHWGETSHGRWALAISDEARDNRGQLNKWILSLHGRPSN